jgi:trimeric autotransporter adhesin
LFIDDSIELPAKDCYTTAMVMRTIGACWLVAVLGACGSVEPAPAPAIDKFHVGGVVQGLWDGADGVALRFESGTVNELLTLDKNGSFSFVQTPQSRAAFTVTVAVNPVDHTCRIASGGTGTVDQSDITTVVVECRGPDVSIALPGPWTFDPTRDAQMFSGSVVMQDVALTVSGVKLAGATVAGVAMTLDAPSAPIPLALGVTNVPVAVTTDGGLSKTYDLVFDRGGAALQQAVYGKASNSDPGDVFGGAIAISGDTLVIGATAEDSAPGINDGDNDSAPDSGAVYVFVRREATWVQQAYIKASNAQANDFFGMSVALSGNTLAVGAPGEDSASVQINVGSADNTATGAGAVYVFVRTGTTWTQQAYIKAPNTGADDEFGGAVALSGDTLAVAALGEDSRTRTINGNMNDETASDAGAVYVFVRSGVTWAHQAYLKASNADPADLFGFSVALSANTLAVGADNEASAARGVDAAQDDNTARGAGAVYVFVRSGVIWTQQGYLKASNTGAGDFFGNAVALSGDTLAVSAYHEASAAIGINGDEADDSATNGGAVYLFTRSNAAWSQQAYIKASNTAAGDLFGATMALSDDVLAVGAYHEDSANDNQVDNGARNAGAVYVFARRDATWSQTSYVKASNIGIDDLFGWAVALAPGTLAVTALQEASCATGVNPVNGQLDEGCASAGAVYVFR